MARSRSRRRRRRFRISRRQAAASASANASANANAAVAQMQLDAARGGHSAIMARTSEPTTQRSLVPLILASLLGVALLVILLLLVRPTDKKDNFTSPVPTQAATPSAVVPPGATAPVTTAANVPAPSANVDSTPIALGRSGDRVGASIARDANAHPGSGRRRTGLSHARHVPMDSRERRRKGRWARLPWSTSRSHRASTR